MLRHRSFESAEELMLSLRDVVPQDAYVSCAYYEDPEVEMERKGWLGADLVFDIDADHIPTACDKIHDEWACGKCGFTGRGPAPDKCPACGGEKFNESTWPCEICLASAKSETAKLLTMLMDEFGFSEKEIRLFFSGHRGYHVHIENTAIQGLDSVARKEIVDYLYGLGLDLTARKSGTNQRETLSLRNPSWRRRMALGMKEFIRNVDPMDLIDIGARKNEINRLKSTREDGTTNVSEMESLRRPKNVRLELWERIAERGINLQSAKIDTVVTTDIHRLIRLADTLHGKTGFKKTKFEVSNIDIFDPFKSAIAFRSGSATVLVFKAPEFRIGEEMFGPYGNQKVELPTSAAVMLICKGRAEIIE